MNINNNAVSMRIFNKQKMNEKRILDTFGRLSSGKRINKASDDAAGLAISQKMRAQIRGLDQASFNAQDGISLIQTAEGSLEEMGSIAQRMRELSVQGSNGTLTEDDRNKIQSELDSLKSELHNIAENTQFNTMNLLDGSYSSMKKMTSQIKVNRINVRPDLLLPSGGAVADYKINVNGEEIKFKFKDDLSSGVDIVILNGEDTIGTGEIKKIPDLQWDKNYGGSHYDEAFDLQQTSDGGFIVAGRSKSQDGDVGGTFGGDNSDYWIIKTDSSGNIQWKETYGGNDLEVAKSIKQTPDGGYVVVGEGYSSDGDLTKNNGSSDYWITKLSSTGTMQWQKSYGGSGPDYSPKFDLTLDGGFIISGISSSNDKDVTGNNGLNDYWVVKLDSSGDLEWQKSLGGSGMDEAQSIIQTNDGGYMVSGKSRSSDGDVLGNKGLDDVWLVKLKSDGEIDWERNYGGSHIDESSSIIQTDDGGYVFTGKSFSSDGDLIKNNGSSDIWTVKLDQTGSIVWQKSLGGSGADKAESIKQTSDGGYIISGSSKSNDGDVLKNNGDSDYWIIKLDTSGEIEWEKSLGGSDEELAHSIIEADDGSFIAVGYSKSNDGDVSGNNGNRDYWIVKLGPSASILNHEMGIKLESISNKDGVIDFENVVMKFDNSRLSQISMDAVSKTQYEEVTTNELLLHVGANENQIMAIEIDDMRPEALGMTEGLPAVNPIEMAGISLKLSDEVIKKISSQRSKLGAKQNALEHIIANVDNAFENLSASESRLLDADMAKEMVALSKYKILEEASNAMLAQSNQMPQELLKLLR